MSPIGSLKLTTVRNIYTKEIGKCYREASNPSLPPSPRLRLVKYLPTRHWLGSIKQKDLRTLAHIWCTQLALLSLSVKQIMLLITPKFRSFWKILWNATSICNQTTTKLPNSSCFFSEAKIKIIFYLGAHTSQEVFGIIRKVGPEFSTSQTTKL